MGGTRWGEGINLESPLNEFTLSAVRLEFFSWLTEGEEVENDTFMSDCSTYIFVLALVTELNEF